MKIVRTNSENKASEAAQKTLMELEAWTKNYFRKKDKTS